MLSYEVRLITRTSVSPQVFLSGVGTPQPSQARLPLSQPSPGLQPKPLSQSAGQPPPLSRAPAASTITQPLALQGKKSYSNGIHDGLSLFAIVAAAALLSPASLPSRRARGHLPVLPGTTITSHKTVITH
ncbi:hypothetical protein E2C01_007725 [Portunus trituberculatus]|uniref:Uncharacterized protein n=1 Tax=Portunus trituberculatus TaxID=210409 RepID=A0A5B7D0W2_PORTR|nr:hypothetical protein [Portunus trituberculatus]